MRRQSERRAGNIQKLHDLHPAADLPEPPIYLPEALQIDVETLDKVRRANPRGSAAGPSGTTYEHIIAAIRTSDRGTDVSVKVINLILSSTLPRCDSLLDSRLIALSKPRPDGQPDGICPIAMGEVWLRLASLRALASCLSQAGSCER